MTPEPVNVAAGVILDADGRVLLAERPPGKPWPGYWEFPGGKFEAGEDPRAALARELHEELGIDLDQATPWITREHAYPERTVRLHFWRVPAWHGEPHGREGQQLSWQDPRTVQVQPLLPANASILEALRLPPVYAITNAAKYGVEEFMPRLQAALERGARLIQVRERDMQPEQLVHFARQVIEMAHPLGARVLVNGSADIARRAGADGVHVQAGQLLLMQRPPDLPLWGASCHDRMELERAAALGADLAVLSPVLPTQSHPGAPTLGWDRFGELCMDMPMPVFALGGMNLEMLDTAAAHSAHGIALLSGIW